MEKPKKLLIADDEEDISWAVSKSLKKSNLNIDITCVNNGDAALELLRRQPFDLVVSDIRMPGCDGLRLIREIRKHHPATKIIIMTAYGSQEVMDRADALGSFFYLEKPFDIGYMKQLIMEALDLRQQGFKGSIDRAGIRELVQLNCSNKRNSSLFISRQEENGAIYFKNGDIVHAECGQLNGERAFFSILNWNRGTFKIDYNPSSTKRTISRSWKTLLHQCA
ncbi:MAG: response regulator [bacterium]